MTKKIYHLYVFSLAFLVKNYLNVLYFVYSGYIFLDLPITEKIF